MLLVFSMSSQLNIKYILVMNSQLFQGSPKKVAVSSNTTEIASNGIQL